MSEKGTANDLKTAIYNLTIKLIDLFDTTYLQGFIAKLSRDKKGANLNALADVICCSDVLPSIMPWTQPSLKT